MLPLRVGDEMPHNALGVLLELSALTGHERAVGDEPVKRISNERELEETFKVLGFEVGSHLLEREVSVADLGQIGDRQLPVHKQAHLLEILWPHVLAQRLTD